ncbi:MAG: hypothetical protein JST82_09770 [Bacteroidetes bacterium]|nr:hypothetical protein [Bacteroidota bacterium]
MQRIKNLLLAVMMLPLAAQAQYTSLDNQLSAISDEMFANGNENFIIVDAIKDGVIEPEKTYSFMYTNGSFTFNQQALSKKLATGYEKKMKKYFDQFNNGHDFFISITGSKASMKDIFNEESTFRKTNRVNKELQQPKEIKTAASNIVTHTIDNTKTTSTDGIVKAMIQDGLITNKNNYTVKWNLNGIFVNGKKLKGDMAEKYETMFEAQAGFKPTKGEEGIVITATP